VKLLGGDATRHGKLDPHHIMDAKDSQKWLESIHGSTMVPLNFKLEPITDLIKDKTKKANVLQAMQDYAADVAAEMHSLSQDLVPKDPYKQPSWCKFDPSGWKPDQPHAPAASPGKNSKLTSSDMPCPHLPTVAEATARRQHRQRKNAIKIKHDHATAKSNECNPSKTCNVCDECCKSFIPDGAKCDACVAQSCSGKKNECNPAKNCTVCIDCCKSFIPGGYFYWIYFISYNPT
jgi:hypothetical protein